MTANNCSARVLHLRYFSSSRLLKVTAFTRLIAVGRGNFFYRTGADLAYRVGQKIEHVYVVAIHAEVAEIFGDYS